MINTQNIDWWLGKTVDLLRVALLGYLLLAYAHAVFFPEEYRLQTRLSQEEYGVVQDAVTVYAPFRGEVELRQVSEEYAEEYMPPITSTDLLLLGGGYFLLSLLRVGPKTAWRRVKDRWAWLRSLEVEP